MTVTCEVRIVTDASGAHRPLQFAAVPRVGEYVSFSLDGRRDADGILRGETFLVKSVIHTAKNVMPAKEVLIDVIGIEAKET